jgi:hypothetical protein
MVRLLLVSLYVVIYLQEEERQRKKDLEMGGWTGTSAETEDAVKAPPTLQHDTAHLAAESYSDVDENRF